MGEEQICKNLQGAGEECLSHWWWGGVLSVFAYWALTSSAFNLRFRILSHLGSLFRLNQGSILQRSFGQADPLSNCLPQLISVLACLLVPIDSSKTYYRAALKVQAR